MTDIFAKCCCGSGTICIYCLRFTIISIAMITGALIAWKPKKAIEIQIAFYRLINWEIKPVSMELEIRNTRIMGASVIVAGILALVYIYLL